jgi:hypothetical protein
MVGTPHGLTGLFAPPPPMPGSSPRPPRVLSKSAEKRKRKKAAKERKPRVSARCSTAAGLKILISAEELQRTRDARTTARLSAVANSIHTVYSRLGWAEHDSESPSYNRPQPTASAQKTHARIDAGLGCPQARSRIDTRLVSPAASPYDSRFTPAVGC